MDIYEGGAWILLQLK